MESALNENEALAVLGLRSGATSNDVDAAHRRLATRAHPDRWLDAPVEDRDAAQARFDEVNAAYRVLRGSHARAHAPPPGPRRRPPADDAPPPRPMQTMPPPVPVDAVQHDDTPLHGPGPSKALLVVAAGVLAVVLVLVAVGIGSSSPDGGRQRRILGPLAYRFWEAERSRSFGTMWDLSDQQVHATVSRDDFIAHLDLCPAAPAPRDVVRMTNLGGGLWEVASVDGAGQPGLGYFRQIGDYGFAAAYTDPDFFDFLRAPVVTAGASAWCRR